MANIDATTPQLKAVKKLFDGYLSQDPKNVESQFAKNFSYQMFPKSPEHPDGGKEHFHEHKHVLPSFTDLNFIIHEVIEAPGKVIVHFTALYSTPEHNEAEYDTLRIFTLVEESGEYKVTHIKDFSNPEKRGHLHKWNKKVAAKAALAV